MLMRIMRYFGKIIFLTRHGLHAQFAHYSISFVVDVLFYVATKQSWLLDWYLAGKRARAGGDGIDGARFVSSDEDYSVRGDPDPALVLALGEPSSRQSLLTGGGSSMNTHRIA